MLRFVQIKKLTGNGAIGDVSWNLPEGAIRGMWVIDTLAALIAPDITKFNVQVSGDNRVDLNGALVDTYNAKFNRAGFVAGGNILEWDFQELPAKLPGLMRSVCPVVGPGVVAQVTWTQGVAATLEVWVAFDDNPGADGTKYIIKRVLRYGDKLGVSNLGSPQYTQALPSGVSTDPSSIIDQGNWLRLWAVPDAGAIVQLAIYNRPTALNALIVANLGFGPNPATGDVFDGLETGDMKPLDLAEKGYNATHKPAVYILNAAAANYNFILESLGVK
jgi:hypothetical protein